MNTSGVETGEIRYKACFHSSQEENVLGFAKTAQPNLQLSITKEKRQPGIKMKEEVNA
jgi:hypothetical protein